MVDLFSIDIDMTAVRYFYLASFIRLFMRFHDFLPFDSLAWQPMTFENGSRDYL